MPRLHGLTNAELEAYGDPDTLRDAINEELTEFKMAYLRDNLPQYTDEQVHALVDARLAALPETGPVRTAIQKTYELFLVIIDGGVAETRSDHELTTWVEGDGSQWCPGFRPEKKALPS